MPDSQLSPMAAMLLGGGIALSSVLVVLYFTRPARPPSTDPGPSSPQPTPRDRQRSKSEVTKCGPDCPPSTAVPATDQGVKIPFVRKL